MDNNLEIERKFLVCGDFKDAAVSTTRIGQAYINQAGGGTGRARLRDDQAYLTPVFVPESKSLEVCFCPLTGFNYLVVALPSA